MIKIICNTEEEKNLIEYRLNHKVDECIFPGVCPRDEESKKYLSCKECINKRIEVIN